MTDLLFLEPQFLERIWGGNKMEKYYNYNIPNDTTGECWAVSAHKNGDCKVSSGVYTGKSLSFLWKNKRELFGYVEGDRFPLLIKILDAKDDLSVQVHPNDEYAKKHENGELGKTECWYIIDCDEGSELIVGHHAKSKEEMKNMIDKGKWNNLLRKVKIKPGDFFYIPAGTIHAIGKGTLILETQQSSDITYRLYDYGRLQDGQLRELHIKKSVDVSKVPHPDSQYINIYKTKVCKDATIKQLIRGQYFKVSEIVIKGHASFTNLNPFQIMSVINGEGFIDGIAIKKGVHFIIPYGYEKYKLEGNMKLIVSHI